VEATRFIVVSIYHKPTPGCSAFTRRAALGDHRRECGRGIEALQRQLECAARRAPSSSGQALLARARSTFTSGPQRTQITPEQSQNFAASNEIEVFCSPPNVTAVQPGLPIPGIPTMLSERYAASPTWVIMHGRRQARIREWPHQRLRRLPSALNMAASTSARG